MVVDVGGLEWVHLNPALDLVGPLHSNEVSFPQHFEGHHLPHRIQGWVHPLVHFLRSHGRNAPVKFKSIFFFNIN